MAPEALGSWGRPVCGSEYRSCDWLRGRRTGQLLILRRKRSAIQVASGRASRRREGVVRRAEPTAVRRKDLPVEGVLYVGGEMTASTVVGPVAPPTSPFPSLYSLLPTPFLPRSPTDLFSLLPSSEIIMAVYAAVFDHLRPSPDPRVVPFS